MADNTVAEVVARLREDIALVGAYGQEYRALMDSADTMREAADLLERTESARVEAERRYQCGLSFDGCNLYGDKLSIARAEMMMRNADMVPELRARLTLAERALAELRKRVDDAPQAVLWIDEGMIVMPCGMDSNEKMNAMHRQRVAVVAIPDKD
jgi:hypothetical protein